jgi:hypothetical protein
VADQFKVTYADHFIEARSRGLFINPAAAEIGFHRDTIYEWAKTHPEMERAMKLGKAKCALFYNNMLITIASTGIGNIAGVIFALKCVDAEEFREIFQPMLPAGEVMPESDLVLAQRLAFILSRAVRPPGSDAKLINGSARPVNGAATNGHGGTAHR